MLNRFFKLKLFNMYKFCIVPLCTCLNIHVYNVKRMSNIKYIDGDVNTCIHTVKERNHEANCSQRAIFYHYFLFTNIISLI